MDPDFRSRLGMGEELLLKKGRRQSPGQLPELRAAIQSSAFPARPPGAVAGGGRAGGTGLLRGTSRGAGSRLVGIVTPAPGRDLSAAAGESEGAAGGGERGCGSGGGERGLKWPRRERAGAVPGGTGSFRAVPGGTGSFQAVPGGTGSSRAVPWDTGSSRVVPGGTGSFRAVPGGTGSFRAVPWDTGSFRAVPGGTGSFRAVPWGTGSFRAVPWGTGSFRAVPGGTGSSQAVPGGTGSSRAVPGGTGSFRAVPWGTGSSRAVPGRTGSSRAVPGGTGSSRAGPWGTGSFRAVPGGTGSSRAVPWGTGSFRAVPGGTGSSRAVPGGTGSFRAVPGGTGSFQAVPGGTGSFRAVPGGTGSSWERGKGERGSRPHRETRGEAGERAALGPGVGESGSDPLKTPFVMDWACAGRPGRRAGGLTGAGTSSPPVPVGYQRPAGGSAQPAESCGSTGGDPAWGCWDRVTEGAAMSGGFAGNQPGSRLVRGWGAQTPLGVPDLPPPGQGELSEGSRSVPGSLLPERSQSRRSRGARAEAARGTGTPPSSSRFALRGLRSVPVRVQHCPRSSGKAPRRAPRVAPLSRCQRELGHSDRDRDRHGDKDRDGTAAGEGCPRVRGSGGGAGAARTSPHTGGERRLRRGALPHRGLPRAAAVLRSRVSDGEEEPRWDPQPAWGSAALFAAGLRTGDSGDREEEMGTQRAWGARGIGREEGDSPGRSWNGAGQGPGIRPGWVQHRGLRKSRRRGETQREAGVLEGAPRVAFGMRVPASPQAQGERAMPGTRGCCVPPREKTSRGPGRGGRKTKRGRGSGGERQPGASGAGCGPSRQGMAGPVRPSPGGASIRIAAVTGGGARPGRRARRGAALQHCRSPLLPRSFSALRRRSAPEAQLGPRTGPAALRSHSRRAGHPSPPGRGPPPSATSRAGNASPSRDCSRGTGTCTHRRGSVIGVKPALISPARVEGPAAPVGAFARPRAASAVPRFVPATSPRSPATLPGGLAMP
ncbi:collagen alpha-2(I) chain-like [Molothrus ater]|uniref:collagen alpha-2(I) chain-like n=1 Tax=Molothrus ater TaxID=84834 RepID=UPI0023E7AC37|nr:collagen alpha-2(I) chain-like [Molothrus ater]